MKYFDAVKVENIEIKITEDAKPFLASTAINSDGENYYDFQKAITTKYTCVINAGTNVVRYITEDASAISPGAGERIFGIDEITAEGSATGDVAFDGTWKFNEETHAFYQDTVLVAERALQNNKATFDRLLRICTDAAFPLQSAASLGVATDEQKNRLAILQQYSVDLLNVDLTGTNPGWPVPPSFLI